MVKEADRQLSRNFELRLWFDTARQLGFHFNQFAVGIGYEETAVTRYDASDWKACISRSRSTIRRTATDCTRPAESAGFTFSTIRVKVQNPRYGPEYGAPVGHLPN